MRSRTNDHVVLRLDLFVLTSREQKLTKKWRSHYFKLKQITLPQQNLEKLCSLIEKYLAKTAQKAHEL